MTDHIGFHFKEYDEDLRTEVRGIYYGKYNEDKREIICSALIKENNQFPFVLIPYALIDLDGNRVPYVYYDILGQKGNSPVSQFYLKLKFMGIPLSQSMVIQLTEKLHDLAGAEKAYREIGYRLEENKIKLITLNKTYKKFNETYPEEKNEEDEINESIEILRELYRVTTDKNAFIIIFAYSLFAPLASMIKSSNLMFPNLIVMGPPEAGKNSILNLLLAKAWGNRDNVKVVGDFKTDFASLRNLEGMGLPLVINDLDQMGYDRLRDYLLDGAMNDRGGSRGRADLTVEDFQVKRAIAISSNYLKVGAPEFHSRFIILQMQENDGNNESWNQIAKEFEGRMPYIATKFLNNVLNRLGIDVVLQLFGESRTKVKETIVTMGQEFLASLFPDADPLSNEITYKDIIKLRLQYDVVDENYFELLYSWIQIKLAQMAKETSYTIHDYKEIVTVSLDNSLYLRDEGDKYVVFGAAFDKFLKENPSFPFKSMHLFANKYSGLCKDIPRKYKIGEQRMSFRVLEINKMGTMIEEPREVEI